MNTACRMRTVSVAFGGFGSQEQKQLQFSPACPKVSLERYPHDRVRKTGCPTHRSLNLKIELAASTNVLERMYAPQPCWSERGRWPPRPATIQEWHSDPQERAHQQGVKMRQHSLVGHLACRFVCPILMDQRKTFISTTQSLKTLHTHVTPSPLPEREGDRKQNQSRYVELEEVG